MNKNIIKKIFSANLRAERARINLTQEKLAELSHVSTEYISRLENAKVCPTILVVTNIALALDVDINILLPMETIKKLEKDNKKDLIN